MDREAYDLLCRALAALEHRNGMHNHDLPLPQDVDEPAVIDGLRELLGRVTAVRSEVGETACAWCGTPSSIGAYVCPEHAPPPRVLAGAV